MRHTIREYLDFYKDVDKDVDIIVIEIASHKVVIDTNEEGSLYLIRTFRGKPLYFKEYSDADKTLVLSINP